MLELRMAYSDLDVPHVCWRDDMGYQRQFAKLLADYCQDKNIRTAPDVNVSWHGSKAWRQVFIGSSTSILRSKTSV